MQEMRQPDAELVHPDGTRLTLFRNVKWKPFSDGTSKPLGDFMVAEPPNDLRVAVYFYEENGEQRVEIVYDHHVMKYGDDTTVARPENPEYRFTEIDDKPLRLKYLKWYAAFPKVGGTG